MAAPAWHAGLSPDLVEAATSTLAVVEHCGATLPGGFHGYTPLLPPPKALGGSHTWGAVTEEYDVKVYGRNSDAGPPFAVGVTHFPQDADTVAAFLFTPDNMGRWNDELCEKGEVLKMLNDDAALGYLIYYPEEALGFTIVSSRNLVILTVRQKLEDGTILIGSNSVADSLGPAPPKGTVRARLLSGGGIIKPSPEGGCDVMFMTQVDFGGSLPQSIVTMVSKTSPLALAMARKILREAAEAAAKA